MEIDGKAFSPPLFSLSICLGVSSKLPNSAPKYDGAIFGHKAFSLCLSIWGHFIQQWVPESRAPVATTKDELDGGGSWRSYLCALEPELEGKRHKTRGTKIQISLLCAFVSQRKLQRRSMKYRRSRVTSLLRLHSFQIEFSFSII